jgi:hypothetical protein
MSSKRRTIADLQAEAILHWPTELLQLAGHKSTLPILLKTQDAFISLLKICDNHPKAWICGLEQSRLLSGSLFLKHLMVASDLGGEALNKLPPLSRYFPKGILKFEWQGQIQEYPFKKIQAKCSLSNSALGVDAQSLLIENKSDREITDIMQDVAMLLLFGSSAICDTLPEDIKEKCILGSLLGKCQELDRFAKENYLRVSRQVAGATSNDLGHLAQDYVLNHLQSLLPSNWKLHKDSSLPKVSHTQDQRETNRETNFDIVVQSPQNQYCGIEVSFQVTTNSVIERKARESSALLASAHNENHKICYVIDGVGNIEIRKSAINILLENSDFVSTMSPESIQKLAEFLIKNL